MAIVLFIVICIVGTWIVARATAPGAKEGASEEGTSRTSSAQTAGPSVADSALDSLGDVAHQQDGIVIDQSKSQLTYIRLSDGMHLGSANERFARPALSLSKLYIADYVIDEGTGSEKYDALQMISNSDDGIAEELFAIYPESIDEVAKKYGLYSTDAGEYWGRSVTSTYDVVKFIQALKDADPLHPILVAMSQPDEIAADGYEQDFGTAVLKNVIGAKWGWSNDRDIHASVSFGDNFIVAASVTGSARDLTKLVRTQLSGQKLKEATTWFLESQKPGGGRKKVSETIITD
ncbi:hypothetical protein AYJ05_12440 [Corynebacterium stationis]|uniref:Serine hydrolase n=1 Tax=Corynebacterium stationis TaxID=1705 RepID=A0A177ITH9_9CORY|nr:hypothetical protein AYJ05_12440 [Corynebacterium stationis]